MTATTQHANTRPIAVTLILGLAAMLLVSFATPAPAQDDGIDGSFTGDFRLGFRTVDVNGAERKFDEDYNIDQGPRLFDFHIDFVPDEGARKLVDRIELDAQNLGGDAFETLRLSARKFGSWDFQYNRTVSEYFYDDIILPVAQAGDPALAFAGDFHTFDFERVRDTARFNVDVNERAGLHFGFERYTRVGESTTTLDVSRDEFEVDRPIDESMNRYNAGFEYKWDKVTLILEEQFEEFDNEVTIFLPGFSLGEDPADATTLSNFFSEDPYELQSYRHALRLNVRPNSRLQIRAAAALVDLDVDFESDESSAGTDFRGNPFQNSVERVGDIELDAELLDVDLSYQITDRVAFIGAVRNHSTDQEGNVQEDGDFGLGAWDIETFSIDAGVEVSVRPGLVISGGLREEERDVEEALVFDGDLDVHQETTDHTGWFANLGWSPNRDFRLDLSFEDSSIDDPFTLASATDRQRARVRARYKFADGWSLSGNYLLRSYENDNSGWDADYDQGNLNLLYDSERVGFALGYGFADIDRSIFQEVVTLPGFGGGQILPFNIDYEAEAEFITGRISYQLNERWSVGGDGRLYENDGSFALEREDLRGWVQVILAEAYALRAGYRTIDYDEDAFNFDDYDADVLELSVGYRW